MSVPQMDAVDHQRILEEKDEMLEDDQRLKIGPGVRFYLDKASVIKYENGLAYNTANKSIFRQANAICESGLEKLAQRKASGPASDHDRIIPKLSNLLSTHARLETRLDGALDRLQTLAGSKHRGYAAMRAWTYHFDAVAELVDALPKMEKGILEDEGIKAFVAGEKGKEKINGTGGGN